MTTYHYHLTLSRYDLLLTAYYLRLAAYDLRLTTHYSLLTTHYWPPAYHLPLTARYSLLLRTMRRTLRDAHCAPHTTHCVLSSHNAHLYTARCVLHTTRYALRTYVGGCPPARTLVQLLARCAARRQCESRSKHDGSWLNLVAICFGSLFQRDSERDVSRL